MEQKILNVQWFGKIGIVTIDNGIEIKTYIKEIEGNDEKQDIQDILKHGTKVYPQQFEFILDLHKGIEPRV